MLGVKPMPTFPMEELLRCAPCGLFSYDGEGTLVAVNDTLLDLLGYTRDELLGRPMTTLLPLAGRMFCETHVFPLLRMQGRADEIQLPLRSKGGESIPVLLNAVRKEHEDGVLHHCAFMSVRERGKYEGELLKSKRMAEEALRSNDALNQCPPGRGDARPGSRPEAQPARAAQPGSHPREHRPGARSAAARPAARHVRLSLHPG
ncbi:PAS domain-containing protein [Cystobacter fuscus]